MEEVNICYSIVSRGTEKYNNCGYMAVSEDIGGYKYIMDVNHNIKKSLLNDRVIKFRDKYMIYNIVFSRFQLITALMYEKHKNEIKDNILILGLGNIGITCLFYLLDKGYKNITLYVRKIKNYMLELISIIESNYGVVVSLVETLEEVDNYNTYIDTTGSSEVLNCVFDNISFNKSIVILSTPREVDNFISLLTINRKNLTVIGSHEINGIDMDYRTKLFEVILDINAGKHYLKKFINIYDYSLGKLNDIKKNKNNFIEIFKY